MNMSDNFSNENAKKASRSRSIMEDIYVPGTFAKEEILRRWNDKDLKGKVERFLGCDIPEPLRNEPMVLLGRTVASPNEESFKFLEIARRMGIKPLFGEYLDDKFLSTNFDKYCLGKLSFRDGDKIISKEIVDMEGSEGHLISQVKTFWGESLIAFHHRMFENLVSDRIEKFDFSSWLSRQGSMKNFYVRYFALFLCHGVLVEDFFENTDSFGMFFREVILPSLEEVESVFRLKPLIVPLPGIDTDRKYYPSTVKSFIPE